MANGVQSTGLQSQTVNGTIYATDGDLQVTDGSAAISGATQIIVTQPNGTVVRAYSPDNKPHTLSLTYVPFLERDILSGSDSISITPPNNPTARMEPRGRPIDLTGTYLPGALATAVTGIHIDGIAYASDAPIMDGPNGAEVHNASEIDAIILGTGERLHASSRDGSASMSLLGNIIVQSGTVTIQQTDERPVHLEPERGKVNLNVRAPQFAR